MLPRNGDHRQAARVIGIISNNEGQAIGEFNQNLILNTKVYDIIFLDVAVHQYAANTISKNIYYQVDKYGN